MAKEFGYLQRLVHDKKYELSVFEEGWISNKEIRKQSSTRFEAGQKHRYKGKGQDQILMPIPRKI